MTRPPMRGLLVAIALVLGLGLAWWLNRPAPVQDLAWFYDLNTGALFSASKSLVPPIPAPSGDLHGAPPGTPAGVLATVITVGKETLPRVVFLKTADPAKPRRSPESDPALLIALPPAHPGERITWRPSGQWTSRRLMEEFDRVAGGGDYKLAQP